MTLARALQVAAGNSQESADVAEAIDFAANEDFLKRSSDLIGNVNGSQFTFSFWTYMASSGTNTFVYSNESFRFFVTTNQVQVNIVGKNTTGSTVLDVSIPTANSSIANTWNHVLVSFDLSNSTRKRAFINDVSQTITTDTYSIGGVIDFTDTAHYIHGGSGIASNTTQRLSNVFLDYTYRDLTVTADRRLFVTADLKPAAGQAALNPILYLPMDDPTAPGVNAGTGGNFTLTGTVARSGRGPNQFNAPYSTLTTGDYLSRTTVPTGIADSKQFTLSFSMMLASVDEEYVMAFGSSTTNRFRVQAAGNLGQQLMLEGWNASGTQILFAAANLSSSANKLVVGRNYMVTISLDLADTAKRFIYINGQSKPVTWITYTNDLIDFNIATSPVYRIGQNLGTTQFDGKLGALWFNTNYIDLSVADNLAKFVTGTGIDAKPVDLGASGELPTGTSPLIYLPMYGNNAGKNYGTGGDFTVNSGPYTGARGPNEYWGNILAPANGGGSYSSNYLKRASSLVGVTSNKTLSASFFFRASAVGSVFVLFDSGHSSGASGFRISVNASNQIVLAFTNSSSLPILSATTTSASIAANTWYHVCFSVDMSNSANRSVYVNGTSITTTWSTYSNNDLPLADVINLMIDGLSSTLGNTNQTLMSEFYLNNSYIDFTQEANRLKFRDAFGNPVNLTQQIEDAAIPNPAIYMRFPPTAFGTNYGTGGDFTVNGTITDGGQL